MSLWVRWGSRFVALILCSLTLFQTGRAAAPSPTAYVLGANDAGVVRVNLATGAVTHGVATVGSFPNRIEVGPRGGLAAVVNSGSDDVTLLNLRSETVIGTVALPPGSNPWTAEVLGRRVFVTCLLTNQVYEIDARTLAVVDSASTGKSPEGMAIAGGRLFVANTGFDFGTFGYDPGSVTVLSLRDLSTVATVSVSLNPQECRTMPDGNVHVVCTGDFFAATGSIDVLDPETSAVVRTMAVPDGFPGAVSQSEGEGWLGVTTLSFGSAIWSYDVASLTMIHDATSPLLPSFDFYGELTVAPTGELLVPSFSRDLLLVEVPSSPGSPAAHSVGDGPIDVAFAWREEAPDRSAAGRRGNDLSRAGTPEAIPRRLAFAPIQPNPSRGPLSFEVRSPRAAEMTVTLLDVRGRTVARLASGRAPAGTTRVTWDGTDERGRRAGPGVYFLRAEAGGEMAVERIVRLR